MAYLSDVVSANIFAMSYEEQFSGDFFDVGTGNNISLNEVKDIILKYHPDLHFDYVAPREGDVRYTKADMSKLANIGWRPDVTISEGIDKCFRV